jgi:hypothetical protein
MLHGRWEPNHFVGDWEPAMPLVFVHGVNNRRGETPEEKLVFDNRMQMLKEHFSRIGFADRVKGGLAVYTPYWGDLGVEFARNLACLPRSNIQALAVGEPDMLPLIEATAGNLDSTLIEQAKDLKEAPLLSIAINRSLSSALDLLFAGIVNAPVPAALSLPDPQQEVFVRLADFAEAAERYAAQDPNPLWLREMNNDDEFVSRFMTEVAAFTGSVSNSASLPSGQIEALSVGSDLKSFVANAAGKVRRSVVAVVDSAEGAAVGAVTSGARRGFLKFAAAVRPTASASFGRFFGDVFRYMQDRKPIVDRVLDEINKAVAAKTKEDKELYLVGHSFGGIILYDILTKFKPDLVCDLFLTVGSQVALFAEIGRLADDDNIRAAFSTSPSSVAPRPAAALRWLNIFDSTDFVGFGTQGVFSGTLDFRFETDAFPLVSHGAYFDTPRFFARLRERVNAAFLT